MELTRCNLKDAVSVHFHFMLDATDWFQVNFRGSGQRDILLHFSIRREEQIIVANDEIGQVWGAAIYGDLPDPESWDVRSFALVLDGEQFRLMIDGTDVMRIDRGRFRLDEITDIQITSEIQKKTLKINEVISGGGTGGSSLVLGKDLMLHAYSLDRPGTGDGVTISVEGSDATIPCVVETSIFDSSKTDTPHVDIHAVFPGYVWESLRDDSALVLRVNVGGSAIGAALTLTREDVVRAIESIAENIQTPDQGILEAISAVEHVRFANLFPSLSRPAADFIRETVNLFKLTDFLELPEGGISATPPDATDVGLADPDAVALLTIACRERVARAIRQDPDADHAEFLTKACDDLGLSGSPNLGLALYPLAEHFCWIDRFESLFHIWHAAGNDQDSLPLNQTWGRSIALPFLFMMNEYDHLAHTLDEIALNKGDWINTACISWTLKAVLRNNRTALPQSQVRAIVQSFTNLVDKRAQEYWERSSCCNLIDATVFLLQYKKMFAVSQRDSLDTFALRCYGFSPVFWDMLTRRDPGFQENSPWLAAGHAAYLEVVKYVDTRSDGGDPTRAHAERAFDFFDSIHSYEADRIRLEVFGISGQLDDPSPTLLSLPFRRSLVEAKILRHLAFPNARKLSTDFAPVSRKAIANRLGGNSISHGYEQIVETVRFAHRMTGAGRMDLTSADRRKQVEDFRHALVAVSGSANGHVGLGIALGSFGDALLNGQVDVTNFLSVYIAEQIDTLDDMAGANRLLRGAFSRFEYVSDNSGHAIAKSLARRMSGKASFPSRLAAAPDPALLDVWLKSPGVFDTLVLVYSCRANLDGRVQDLRSSWLGKLKDLGIPYLVVVGDGKGDVSGDVLEIDAPDNYEGLPQKTLAMLRWVYANTNFANVLKIDDDCYLDVEEYFYSLTYRRHNYYGRTLNRRVGQKPRAWHMSRSTGRRARMELDKSPEPSSFADGGSGYSLSREALKVLAENSATAAGQGLIQVSYSEDKLVGDLLSLSGMKPRSEDYPTVLFRTTHGDGKAIMQWERNFFPSAMSGTKLAHLDNRGGCAGIHESFGEGTLTPKIIWPTNRKVSLHTDAGLMVLMSDEERLEDASAAPVSVVAVVRNEMFMLPHFLAHYRALGVSSFMFVDNCSDDGTLEYLLEQPDTVVFSADGSFKTAAQGSDWKLAMMAQFRVGKWSLIADADELLVYPGYETTPLKDHLARPAFADSDAFLTMMLDMYPKGRLADVTFESGKPFDEAGYVDRKAFLSTSVGRGAFGNRLTRTSSLRHRLMPNSRPELFVSEKMAMIKYKPWMRFSLSFHYATEVKLASQPMALAHFKYNAEFIAKAKREIARGQYFNGSEEYKKYTEILSEAQDIVYDADVSVPWFECDEIRQLFGEAPLCKSTD